MSQICRGKSAGTSKRLELSKAFLFARIWLKVKLNSHRKTKFRSYGIVRSSLLLGSREEFRGGELAGKIFAKLCSPLFVENFKRYKPVHAKDVAVAMQKPGSGTEEGN